MDHSVIALVISCLCIPLANLMKKTIVFKQGFSQCIDLESHIYMNAEISFVYIAFSPHFKVILQIWRATVM